MKIEKVAFNKIKAVIETEELASFGITAENILLNPASMQEIFYRIVEQSKQDLGFPLLGPIHFQVTGDKDSALTVIATLSEPLVKEDHPYYSDSDCNCPGCLAERQAEAEGDDDDIMDIFRPVEVVEEDKEGLFTINYTFDDLEPIVQVAHLLHAHGVIESRLYFYEKKYHLLLDGLVIGTAEHKDCKAILSEYGQKTTTTSSILDEYGKVIFPEYAVPNIVTKFSK